MRDVDLDERTWSGLEYLESVSGPGAIAELVEAFKQDLPGRLVRLQAALDAGDRPSLGRLAHDLKSNSATLGVTRLSALAARLELAARDGSAPDLAPMLEEVAAMLPPVLRAIEARARLHPA